MGLFQDCNKQRRHRIPNCDFYQNDTTDAAGHFSLRGLNPGKYTVVAFEDLQEDFRQPDFLQSHKFHGDAVQLDEGSRRNVVLTLNLSDQ
jgi:hypothetical protein